MNVLDLEVEDSDQPESAQFHRDQAYLYEERGAYEEALYECDAAIGVAQPFLADMYNLRGMILEELGRDEEAMQAYKTAILIDSDLHEAANNLSELESELGLGRRLVTIATFSQPAEAYVLKAKLETEGIWSFVADELTVTTYWLYSNAIGGVKLQVREQDVERALDILGIQQNSVDLVEDEFDEEDEEPKCPNCNSLNIYYERYANRGLFASWLLLGFPLPFLKRKWRCGDCGYEWKI